MSDDGGITVWLRHPGDSPHHPPVLVTHADTLARCLAEGWVQVEQPTAVAPAVSVEPPVPAEQAQPQPRPKRAQREAEKALARQVSARNDNARAWIERAH